MPDELKCPRCGKGRGVVDSVVDYAAGGTHVYRCTTVACGPLAVVEGGKVAWYYPDGGEELALLREHFDLAYSGVCQSVELAQEHAAKVLEAAQRVRDWRAAHPEARP